MAWSVYTTSAQSGACLRVICRWKGLLGMSSGGKAYAAADEVRVQEGREDDPCLGVDGRGSPATGVLVEEEEVQRVQAVQLIRARRPVGLANRRSRVLERFLVEVGGCAEHQRIDQRRFELVRVECVGSDLHREVGLADSRVLTHDVHDASSQVGSAREEGLVLQGCHVTPLPADRALDARTAGLGIVGRKAAARLDAQRQLCDSGQPRPRYGRRGARDVRGRVARSRLPERRITAVTARLSQPPESPTEGRGASGRTSAM